MNNHQSALQSILQSGRYVDHTLSAAEALYAETLLLSELLVAVECGVMGHDADAQRLAATLEGRLLPMLEAKMQKSETPQDRWRWAEARFTLISAIDAIDETAFERFRSDLVQAASAPIESLDEANQVALHLLRLQTVADLTAAEASAVFPGDWFSALQDCVKTQLEEVAHPTSTTAHTIAQAALRWQLIDAATIVCHDLATIAEAATRHWYEESSGEWRTIVTASTPADRLLAYAAFSRFTLLPPAALNNLLEAILTSPTTHSEPEVFHLLAACRQVTAEAELEDCLV